MCVLSCNGVRSTVLTCVFMHTVRGGGEVMWGEVLQGVGW